MEGKRPLTEESGEDTTNNLLLPPQSQAVPPGNKRTVVDHTYHDYSRVFEAVDRKKGLNYPAKLHLILSDPGCSHVSRDCDFANDEIHCFNNFVGDAGSGSLVCNDLATILLLNMSCNILAYIAAKRSSHGW